MVENKQKEFFGRLVKSFEKKDKADEAVGVVGVVEVRSPPLPKTHNKQDDLQCIRWMPNSHATRSHLPLRQ